jgi:hypothetical protein
MHWFDDFVKELAGGRVSRRAAIGGVGFASASLAVVNGVPRPAAASKNVHLENQTLHTQAGAGSVAPIAPTRGIVRERFSLPSTFTSGPCSYNRSGGTDEMTYVASTTANGKTVTLTVERRLHFPLGVDSSRLTVQATNSLEVTMNGSSVVRVETNLTASRIAATPNATVSIRYGDAVQGARGADLTVQGRSVRGTVLSATRIVPGRNAKIVSAQFVDGVAPVQLAIDPQLYAAIDQLFERFGSENRTCTGIAPRRRRVVRRVQNRATFLSPRVERREDAVAYASYAGEQYGAAAGVEPQNQYGAPSTPDCTSCMNAAASDMGTCWKAAGVSAVFGCFLCAVGDLIACQAKATGAALLCWVAHGGCDEVGCGPGTSCDTGNTCCGSDCCTGSDICVSPGTTCCPQGYTTVCPAAQGYDPFCCGAQWVCCGINGCCNPGSTCCGGKFCCNSGNACCGSACCDAGYTCADPAQSLCCGPNTIPCGSTCCDANTLVCIDATQGICGARGDVVCGNVACGPGSCLGSGANAVCCPGPVCGDRCCSLIGPSAKPQGGGATMSPVQRIRNGGTYTPAPAPTPGGPRIRTCKIPYVPCQTQMNGKPVTLCCQPQQLCCGDQCCAPGLTCCPDAQGNPECNRCIK